jgi:hypothetical protein
MPRKSIKAQLKEVRIALKQVREMLESDAQEVLLYANEPLPEGAELLDMGQYNIRACRLPRSEENKEKLRRMIEHYESIEASLVEQVANSTKA